jgi:hypothetical protein
MGRIAFHIRAFPDGSVDLKAAAGGSAIKLRDVRAGLAVTT